jgi:hypothetical protein
MKSGKSVFRPQLTNVPSAKAVWPIVNGVEEQRHECEKAVADAGIG